MDSEIVADFWSIARSVSLDGRLLGVLSVPAAFVFRVNVDDPHRPRTSGEVSAAIGHASTRSTLARARAAWSLLYPIDPARSERREIFASLEACIPSSSNGWSIIARRLCEPVG